VAFALGGKFDKSKLNFGFKMVGTHKDSTKLKLKSVRKKKRKKF